MLNNMAVGPTGTAVDPVDRRCNMDIIVKDDKEREKIMKEHNYFCVPTGMQNKTMAHLTKIYSRLDSQIRDVWEYYANVTKTPAFKQDSLKVYPSLKAGRITHRKSKMYGTGISMFVRQNAYAINRYIINSPRFEPLISSPPIEPPNNLKAKIIDDSIEIIWNDYYPLEKFYSDFKSVHIFSSLYYTCYAIYIGNKRHKIMSKIINVVPFPTTQKFTIKHLLIHNNYLVELKNVKQCRLHFQMDSCVLIDNYTPIISGLSNIATITWSNSKDGSVSNEIKKIEQIIQDSQLIPRKTPIFKNESYIIQESNNPEDKRIEHLI